MITLFLLLCFGLSKVEKAMNSNFDTLLEKFATNIVFFTSKKCKNCKRILTSLEQASTKFEDTIGFLQVDVELSKSIIAKYNISFVPQIAVFRNSRFLTFYTKEWAAPIISQYCQSLLSTEITHLNTSFEVFDFQHTSPANLILASDEAIKKADELSKSFAGIIKIGVIDNLELGKKFKLAPAQLNRPLDQFSTIVQDFSEESLIQLIKSPFVHIENQDAFGVSTTQYSILALMDERDPLHYHDIIKRFKIAYDFFGENISYHYCDFLTCEGTVKQVGLVNFAAPVFVFRKQATNQRFFVEPYTRMFNAPDEICHWLKEKILGIPMPRPKEQIKIPRMYANDFIPTALNPKNDVILLVATPTMQFYEESQENIRLLIQAFENFTTVKFYEFNPETEHVQGLDIPKSDKPQLSVWPASTEPHGSTFAAYVSIPIIIENLLKLITTPISDAQVEKIAKTIEKIILEANQKKN